MAYRREIALALMLALLLCGLWLVVGRLDGAQSRGQNQFVYDAVHNAALTCYAVEGAYPEDLNYLRQNYGLSYDENRYFVVYSAFASNLMPEIRVMEVEAENG